MEDEILDLLDDLGTGLDESHFASILNVPDQIYGSFMGAQLMKLDTENHPYNHWKARQCELIGAKVLIDDMGGKNISAAGCRDRNIVLIHPFDLLGIPRDVSNTVSIDA